MNVPQRIVGFALVLAAALGGGAALGAAVGPIEVNDEPPATHDPVTHDDGGPH